MHSRTLSLLLFAAAACRTTTTSSPPGADNVFVTRTNAVRAWELWEGGKCLGSTVRYADPHHLGQGFFSVRNRDQQDLGMIDIEGRAWRYRPHQREPEWIGTGTVLEGARRILDAGERAELIEIGLEMLADKTRVAEPK